MYLPIRFRPVEEVHRRDLGQKGLFEQVIIGVRLPNNYTVIKRNRFVCGWIPVWTPLEQSTRSRLVRAHLLNETVHVTGADIEFEVTVSALSTIIILCVGHIE